MAVPCASYSARHRRRPRSTVRPSSHTCKAPWSHSSRPVSTRRTPTADTLRSRPESQAWLSRVLQKQVNPGKSRPLGSAMHWPSGRSGRTWPDPEPACPGDSPWCASNARRRSARKVKRTYIMGHCQTPTQSSASESNTAHQACTRGHHTVILTPSCFQSDKHEQAKRRGRLLPGCTERERERERESLRERERER